MANIVEELRNEIVVIQKRIDTIQNECSHPKTCVISIPRSSIGYWDTSDDEYWVDNHCQLCQKDWRTKQ